MGAPIQRLWHHVSHWPFLNALLARTPASGLHEAPDNVAPMHSSAISFCRSWDLRAAGHRVDEGIAHSGRLTDGVQAFPSCRRWR